MQINSRSRGSKYIFRGSGMKAFYLNILGMQSDAVKGWGER